MTDDTGLPPDPLAATLAAALAAPASTVIPDEGEHDAGPSDMHEEAIDLDVVRACAGFDHSDTDNGQRLLRHFGRDLLVVAQEGVAGGDWAVWSGKHWDLAAGAARAAMTAQRLGGRIGLEAGFLDHTPQELKAIEKGKPFTRKKKDELSQDEQDLRQAAIDAVRALDNRKRSRRSFAVTSKNAGRIANLLAMAAPHLRRHPDDLNANPLKVACATHTLAFATEPDLECPEPDEVRLQAVLSATEGHNRDDLITGLIPVAYDPGAKAPKWLAFVGEFLRDPEKRRTVQQFAGLGLLGIPVQMLMFHHGSGANGKSVFLETLCRLLGDSIAVALPAESISGGGERSAGGPSPDIARLYGKRVLRVSELPPGKAVDIELIKRLTGGERMAVRSLFKGYFEFLPRAKAHWSGNDKPRLDGQDYATFRRLLLVHWDVTIPVERRRDIEVVVNEFLAEGPGILNWLIDGALDYLTGDGKQPQLYIAPSVSADTEEYRQQNDPIGQFLEACVVTDAMERVQASAVFDAFRTWCEVNGRYVPKTGSGLYKVMGARFGKPKEIRGRQHYEGVKLHNVPDRPARTTYHDG